jgi:hypothetical protein
MQGQFSDTKKAILSGEKCVVASAIQRAIFSGKKCVVASSSFWN